MNLSNSGMQPQQQQTSISPMNFQNYTVVPRDEQFDILNEIEIIHRTLINTLSDCLPIDSHQCNSFLEIAKAFHVTNRDIDKCRREKNLRLCFHALEMTGELSAGSYQKLKRIVTLSENFGLLHHIINAEKHIEMLKSGNSIDTRHEADIGPTENDTKKQHAATSELRRKFPRIVVTREMERCCHDGRLIHLNQDCIDDILKYLDMEHPLRGGFGNVYVSRKSNDNQTVEKVPDLDIPVALKIIECSPHDQNKLASVYNEKIAARIMHFAIVPLLAAGEGASLKHYFLSPFLMNGNLADAIENDNSHIAAGTECKLYRIDRVRILYQISSAIDYLHTPVPGVRNAFIHKDITSGNIVLDEWYNARLIDFGLAGELKKEGEHSTFIAADTPGYTMSERRRTINSDYFCFGIVIREMLTGKKPIDSNGYKLRFLEHIECYVMSIWYDDSNLYANANVKLLVELADKCLIEENNTITSEVILTQLKSCARSCRSHSCRWNNPRDETNQPKCDLCMVNPQARDDLPLPIPSCTSHIKVCVACMRNSYLNPIKCHSCDTVVMPSIGHKWGALLFAGDSKVKDEANCFLQDVDDLRQIFVSVCPRYMGISDEHVLIVTPNPDDNIATKTKLKEAFQKLSSSQSIEKLIVYFSGHHTPENGFTLGKNKFLTVAELEGMIKECASMTKFIVILDCCNPPCISLKDVIQINCCRQDEKVHCSTFRSIFTRCLIQALRGNSVEQKCFVNADCTICKNYVKENLEFITVPKLQEYLHRHLTIMDTMNEPVMTTTHSGLRDLVIAYFIDTKVEYVFHLKLKNESEEWHTTPENCTNIKVLRNLLFKQLIEKMKLAELVDGDFVKDFADVTCIIHEKRETDEFDTIEKISAAWNVKLQLCATLRKLNNLPKGRVGLWLPEDVSAKVLYNYLKHYQNESKDPRSFLMKIVVKSVATLI